MRYFTIHTLLLECALCKRTSDSSFLLIIKLKWYLNQFALLSKIAVIERFFDMIRVKVPEKSASSVKQTLGKLTFISCAEYVF